MLGPDYRGDLPADAVGKITSVSGPTVEVEFEDTNIENYNSREFVYDWGKGVFELMPWRDKASKWQVISPLPDELKVGDKVITGPDWRQSDRDADDIGTVEDQKDRDEGQLVYIRFLTTSEELSGPLYYIPGRTLRVVPVELVKKEEELPWLPEWLNDGDRVKRGPTWRWLSQDRGGPGRVTTAGTGHGDWTQVAWDNGGSNGYEYGLTNGMRFQEGSSFGPFHLDIIPEDLDLTREQGIALTWTLAGLGVPKTETPDDSSPNVEEDIEF
jgi:hypothetical protein